MPPLMPAAKFRPVLAEDDDAAAGHVLAAVIADAFDNRVGTAVADAEAFAGDAADKQFPAGPRRTGPRCRR